MMIEYNDTMDTLYQGKEAVAKRIKTRLSHTTRSIPYYDRGIDLNEFTYGSQDIAIAIALRDFDYTMTYDNENKRVIYYDITVNTSDILE